MPNKTKPLHELVSQNQYLRVSPNDLIRNVACQMPEHHTSAAVVLDEKEKLIGIVNEQDIVEKAVGARRNVDETTVDKIMTSDPVTISIDAPFTEALLLMTENSFRTLPVMDGDHVAGIFDIRYLYDALIKLLKEEINLRDGLISYAWGDGYGAVYSKAS